MICFTLLLLFAGNQSFGQQSGPQKKESHKFRTILTIAGGGGGFALGALAGIAAFDDAINSSKKVWTTALVSAAGGAVGGYFLGRALDKRALRTSSIVPPRRIPDELDRSLLRGQWSALQRRVVCAHTGDSAPAAEELCALTTFSAQQPGFAK